MKSKKVMVALAILSFLYLSGSSVSADTGSLIIDNSPINQSSKGDSSTDSIGYQTAPYLFLEKTQSAQQQIRAKTDQILATAKQQSFETNKVTKVSNTTVPTTQKLFSKSYVAVSPTGGTEVSVSEPFPKSLLYLLVGLLLAIVAGIGVMIGRRFSKSAVKSIENKK